MMKNEDNFVEQVLDGFQKLKGRASVYCFSTDLVCKVVYNFISQFSNKHKGEQIFVVVDSYETRTKILEYIEKHPISNDYRLRILSSTYIRPEYNYEYKLIITININDDLTTIKHLARDGKFMLCILTKNIMNNEFINTVRDILPAINIKNFDNVSEDRIFSPVEEHRICIPLIPEDRADYDKFTQFINTTVSILGDTKTIEKCKNGDREHNISAAEFRNYLAKENGWREDLDINIPYMKQIDDLYNPNIILEKAKSFYTIAGNRRNLVSDNEQKLLVLVDILKENKDKKILIVSKRGEFAAKVSRRLNNLDIPCGDYHDNLDDVIAVDEQGKVITIKSGVNKGKVKMLGFAAQSSLSEKRFNSGNINVLSIKSASNTKLKVACDVVIFTSPFCGNIIDLRKRFYNVQFADNTKVYRLYCENTIESVTIHKELNIPSINIVEDTGQENVSYDENSGDIIL